MGVIQYTHVRNTFICDIYVMSMYGAFGFELSNMQTVAILTVYQVEYLYEIRNIYAGISYSESNMSIALSHTLSLAYERDGKLTRLNEEKSA